MMVRVLCVVGANTHKHFPHGDITDRPVDPVDITKQVVHLSIDHHISGGPASAVIIVGEPLDWNNLIFFLLIAIPLVLLGMSKRDWLYEKSQRTRPVFLCSIFPLSFGGSFCTGWRVVGGAQLEADIE